MLGYLKFFRLETGSTTVARLHAGPDAEHAVYAGTIAVETEVFEHFLDALTYGASEVHQGRFEVFEAPDERDVA